MTKRTEGNGDKILSNFTWATLAKTLMSRLKVDTTNNTSLTKHLSEPDFYLGKYYLNLVDKNITAALFKLTIANNVNNFVEHRYALLELALLGQEKDDLLESEQQ